MRQRHITAACDQRCRHCYMFDSPGYKSELESQLTFDECLAIINDYESTLARWRQLCRGCPAQAYALSGDFFGKPAGCWKS